MAASSRASFRLLEENRPSGRLTAYDREIPFWYVPFDVLRVLDLPQLLASSPAAGLMIDPLDRDWNVMKPADARRWLPPAIEATDVESLSGLDDLLR